MWQSMILCPYCAWNVQSDPQGSAPSEQVNTGKGGVPRHSLCGAGAIACGIAVGSRSWPATYYVVLCSVTMTGFKRGECIKNRADTGRAIVNGGAQ